MNPTRIHPDFQSLTFEDLCDLLKDPTVTPVLQALALAELRAADPFELEAMPHGSWHKVPADVWDVYDAARIKRDRQEYIASFNGKFYVNVYEVSRCYGGPEEGGWWFDTGEPVDSTLYTDYSAALDAMEALRDSYPDTGRSSSVLGGEDYRVTVERHPAASYPTERPHYE